MIPYQKTGLPQTIAAARFSCSLRTQKAANLYLSASFSTAFIGRGLAPAV